MMNHSNLLDLKQMRLLWFHGVVSLLGFRRKSGAFSMFAVWHWLLCSWPLSPFPVSLAILLPVFLSFYPLSCSTWKLHGPLCVCVHVCACIYMYREIYMSGLGGGSGVQLRACSQDTAQWSLSSAPSVLVR